MTCGHHPDLDDPTVCGACGEELPGDVVFAMVRATVSALGAQPPEYLQARELMLLVRSATAMWVAAAEQGADAEFRAALALISGRSLRELYRRAVDLDPFIPRREGF